MLNETVMEITSLDLALKRMLTEIGMDIPALDLFENMAVQIVESL